MPTYYPFKNDYRVSHRNHYKLLSPSAWWIKEAARVIRFNLVQAKTNFIGDKQVTV